MPRQQRIADIKESVIIRVVTGKSRRLARGETSEILPKDIAITGMVYTITQRLMTMLSITALVILKLILPLRPRRSLIKYLCLLQKGTALTIIARVENTDRRKPTLNTEKGFDIIIIRQANPRELRESAYFSYSCPVNNSVSITPALTTELLKEARNIIKNMKVHITAKCRYLCLSRSLSRNKAKNKVSTERCIPETAIR